MSTTTTTTAHQLTTDDRFRLALVRLWAEGEAIDDPDGNGALYVELATRVLARAHGVDEDTVTDYLAGALWGMERHTACVRCGDADYHPTCPSCQIDAGMILG